MVWLGRLHLAFAVANCVLNLRFAAALLDAAATAGSRFGKSTHISMISNSVTHLRSYTNSAIADIAANSVPISPVTPRDRR